MVVRFVCVVRVPLCVRVSRESRVCPGSPGVFLPPPPVSFYRCRLAVARVRWWVLGLGMVVRFVCVSVCLCVCPGRLPPVSFYRCRLPPVSFYRVCPGAPPGVFLPVPPVSFYRCRAEVAKVDVIRGPRSTRRPSRSKTPTRPSPRSFRVSHAPAGSSHVVNEMAVASKRNTRRGDRQRSASTG
jgi:hypothetical protein